MLPLYLFMGVLEHIDVPGNTRFITIVGEHLRGEVNRVVCVDTATTQLEMIHGRLGGDIGIDGISVPEIADTCVFDGFNAEGSTATFSSFVHIEIVPQQFLDGIREGAENGSGVIRYDRVDDGPCGRGKHFVVSLFVGSVRG